MASSIGTWRPVPPAAPRRGQSQPQPRQVPRHCCPSLQPESRPFDLSCPPPRLLENYNSLKDKHLAEYFNNTRIRQHLQRSGLISRSGRIIPEKEYRLNAIREEHLRYIREYLAGTLLGKPLDTEHHDHPGAKKQPGKNVKKAKPREVKAKPSRRPVGNTRFTYFPHPPPGPSNRRGLFPPLGRDPAGRSRGRTYRRPHTAPGYVRHTLRFPPLPVRAAAEAVKTPTSEKKCLSPQISQQPAGRERSEVRGPNVMEYVTDISPIINMSLMPVPPPPQQKAGKAVRRGRRLRPITAPSEAEQPPRKSSGVSFRSPVRSDVCVTMAFVGKNVRLFGNGADDRNEIAVYQQHCGGENLCVYKGSLLEGETFQFISRRHQGFPFSLTLFVNGLPVDRLSCCCEFKHQRPFTVGGRHGHFRFLSVEGASPCYRCIIARDLDKTQLPPKEKMEEDHEEDHMGSRADGVCVANGECIEPKCDEDIESEERRIDDQINGTSESPSGDKKTDLDIEKECETLSEKALEVSDSKKDEDDSYSDSDFQDDEQAPDGTVLAEGTRTLDVQEAAEKVAQERQMVAETQALEEADFVEEEEEVCTKEAQEKVEWVGDLLPQEEEVAVLQAEGQLVVEESAPEESAVAEGHPKVQGTGKGREIGTEVALGEQGILVEGMESEADLKEQGPREEELSGAGEELGREEGRMQPEGRGGAEDFSESEEEDSEVEESEREENLEERELEGKDVRGAVCVGEENLEKGEFEGKDVASAVCVGEENLEKGEFEGKDVASAVCVGEENLEKGEFEGKDVASAVCVGEENLEKGEFEGKDVASAVCVGEENLEKGEFEGKDVASAVCVGEENLEKGEFEGKDVASAVCVGEENLEKGEFEGKDVASAVCVGEENLEKGEFEGKDVASAVCVGEENLEKGEFEGKDVASAVCVGEENLEKGEFEGKDVASAVCVGEENLEKGEFEGKDVASAVCVGEENLEKGEFEGKDVASAVCVGEENLEKGEFEGKDVVSAVCVGEENLEKGELEGKDLVPIELSDEEEDMEERGFSREYMLGGVPEAVEDVDEGGFAGKDVVAILVSGGDDTEEGAFAGKDTVTGAVAEREEMGEGGFAGEDDAGMARAESGGGGEAICGAAGSRELGREGSLESGEQR
uniref:DUF4590 domain-containing protein n=1 Tax=Otus sunia TaxID=257818 RepID=A0A8C8BMZ2_9STRI